MSRQILSSEAPFKKERRLMDCCSLLTAFDTLPIKAPVTQVEESSYFLRDNQKS